MPSELINLLAPHASRDAPAILAPGRPTLTHEGLQYEIARTHQSLAAAGIARGSRIALVLPNGPQAAVATLAVASYAACIPLNPAYRTAELRSCLLATRADTVLLGVDVASPAGALATELGLRTISLRDDLERPAGTLAFGPPPVQAAPGPDRRGPSAQAAGADIALLLHTSGTTTRPRIVPLSQSNLSAAARSIAAHLRLGPHDRALNMMPLFHVHGFVASVLATLAAGGSVVCAGGFDGDAFLGWLSDFQPTWYTAAPAIHQAVLALAAARRPLPKHRLRFIRSASSPMPQRLIRELETLLDVPVIEAYGATEASSPIASNPLPPAARKYGSVGRPAGAQVVIADERGKLLGSGETGEILIRGPGVIAAYEADAPSNAAAFFDGWFRTGDLGRFDGDGYLYVVGRIKEIINRGGEKIAPHEVDEALQDLPGVAEAAAFPVPHPTLGEDLAALVVLRAGAAAEPALMRLLLQSRLAEFKIPSRFHVVCSIPRNASGKVHRAGLNDWLNATDRAASEAAATATERWLMDACRDILRVESIGRKDNFLAAGGDSLRAADLVTRVNAAFGLAMTAIDLFEQPAIADFAACVDQRRHVLAQAEAQLLAEIDTLSDEEVTRLLAAQEADTANVNGYSR
jgi:acyl-CoA synthetase (AMP-forming)/AMP-acid ligase II/aryl carrier-like protein